MAVLQKQPTVRIQFPFCALEQLRTALAETLIQQLPRKHIASICLLPKSGLIADLI